MRFNPLDRSDPLWSTRTEGYVTQTDVTNDLAYTSLAITPPGSSRASGAILDLTTGEIAPQPDLIDYRFYNGYTVRASSTQTGAEAPRTLTGLDDAGNQIWQRSESSDTGLSEVLTSAANPGDVPYTEGQSGSGQFLTFSRTTISLVDGLSGETVWSTDAAAACGFADAYTPHAQPPVHASGDGRSLSVYVQAQEAFRCRFDLATGARIDDSPIPLTYDFVYGELNLYQLADGVVTAYDGTTGETLSTTETTAHRLFFAGGRLLALDGFTLMPLG